jgi:hypothetical protein
MKGFPNQVANIRKLTNGIYTLVKLVDDLAQARDDGIFGRALVRAGVAGTGRPPLLPDEYIRQQLDNSPSNQSFRTTARGLRQMYRLLGFIEDTGHHVEITPLGRRAAAYANSPISDEQVDFWRAVMRRMTLEEGGETSHPYQVLLRLVERRPGITRAKCALALEARDDSPEELARIAALADLPEADIRQQLGVTGANWNNAKKILPALAEQLEDVVQIGRSYTLVNAPGRPDDVNEAEPATRATNARAPRTPRAVTAETIGIAGTADRGEDDEILPDPDPAAAAEAIRLRYDRLQRHNLIVRELAGRLSGARLYEDPCDILALFAAGNILVEVKSLDGTEADERDRVRGALGQLLYYEAFAVSLIIGESAVHKVACFEHPISAAHGEWLNGFGVAVLWKVENGFAGDALAAAVLGDYIGELR